MWKFEAVDEWSTISLHDCRITGINTHDNNIALDFADGYWIVETNPQNPYNKTLATDENARLTLQQACCTKLTVDDQPADWPEFCTKLNSGIWEFECITESYKGGQCVYDGWLWFDSEPFHRDCHLEFTFKSIVYNWNKLCEDRPW